MPRLLEKIERRLGEKLFIKGERCLGPKCAVTRRKYPPGIHGKKAGRRRTSFGFGPLLIEKQKIRFLYGLDDRDIARYSREAARRGAFAEEFLKLLEGRLDNVVFRLGFAESRRSARQMVNHGHVLVGERAVKAPSYQTRKGERIRMKDRFARSPMIASRMTQIKKHAPPSWLRFETDGNRYEGFVLASPEIKDIGLTADVTKVKEFYSR